MEMLRSELLDSFFLEGVKSSGYGASSEKAFKYYLSLGERMLFQLKNSNEFIDYIIFCLNHTKEDYLRGSLDFVFDNQDVESYSPSPSFKSLLETFRSRGIDRQMHTGICGKMLDFLCNHSSRRTREDYVYFWFGRIAELVCQEDLKVIDNGKQHILDYPIWSIWDDRGELYYDFDIAGFFEGGNGEITRLEGIRIKFCSEITLQVALSPWVERIEELRGLNRVIKEVNKFPS